MAKQEEWRREEPKKEELKREEPKIKDLPKQETVNVAININRKGIQHPSEKR